MPRWKAEQGPTSIVLGCCDGAHLNGIHDAADGLVVTAQVIDLAREVLLDRAFDAAAEKLRFSGAVEIAI